MSVIGLVHLLHNAAYFCDAFHNGPPGGVSVWSGAGAGDGMTGHGQDGDYGAYGCRLMHNASGLRSLQGPNFTFDAGWIEGNYRDVIQLAGGTNGKQIIRNTVIVVTAASADGDAITTVSLAAGWIGQNYNNTIVNAGSVRGTGIAMPSANGDMDSRNNIVVGFAIGVSGSKQTEDYNCLFGNTAPRSAISVAGTHDLLTDPLLASIASRNLRLLAGSPCISAGAIISRVTNDIIQYPRTAPFDIGAYVVGAAGGGGL